MGTGNAIYYYYYFSKKKKRKEKKHEQEKERKKKERKLNKRKKKITESYFFVIFFFFILINQIGGNLDSSVDIAPNQDVDISVSISLGPRSAGADLGGGCRGCAPPLK